MNRRAVRMERTRNPKELLKAVLVVLISILGVYLIVREAVSGFSVTYVEVILAGLWLVLVLSYILLRYGYLLVASIMAVSVSFLGMSAIAFYGDGARDPAMVTYTLIIVFATLLLGRMAAIVTSLFSIGVIWLMVYLENQGVILYDLMSIGNVGRDLTVIFILTGALSIFYAHVINRYVREINRSRDQYQKLNRALKEQNRQILSFNEELKLAKEKAEESDRLKTAFLTNLSHEIRTPMNGIIGFSELAIEPGITTEDRTEYNQIIASSCKQLLGVVNDIMDMSRIESGAVEIHPETLHLDTLMNEIHHHHSLEAQQSGLQFEWHKSGNGSPDIITDRVKLRQILSNLIGNALKFTQKGSVTYGYGIKGNTIEFFVKDTGPGIPDDRLDAIFDRFTQANSEVAATHGGTGLGLPIAKAYVEMMGGSLEVRSQVGEGTNFTFTIPYKTGQNGSSAKPDESIHPQVASPTSDSSGTGSGRIKVLVVEDIQINERLFNEYLKDHEFEVLTVPTGEEAVELFENTGDLGLIFMDIKLPGMDGLETTRRIRKKNGSIPIVAQTAYAFAEERKKAMDAGCNDVISKPLTKTMVESMLRKYLL